METCILDKSIIDGFNRQAEEIEEKLNSDVVLYFGEIANPSPLLLRNVLEENKKSPSKHDNLALILTTGGGLAEAAAKMVDIMRYHYKTISFFIPECAMSAGTILSLSGDKICMDYYSSLGPVDPQVYARQSDGTFQLVPALGYLDQVDIMIKKSIDGTLSPIEWAILKDMDLAMLKRYEQAKDLSISLIKDWLVKYKFKDWITHNTTPEKIGKTVTNEEKKQRAEEIATALSDHKLWLSHGRKISLDTLVNTLKLKIDDYTGKAEQLLIRNYNDAIMIHCQRTNKRIFIHSRYNYEEA